MHLEIIFDKNDMNYYKLDGLKQFITAISNQKVNAHFEFLPNHLIKIVVEKKEDFGIKWFDNEDDYIKFLEERRDERFNL